MRRILLATRNGHKRQELSELLAGAAIELCGLDSFPHVPETVEDQPTLDGNAAKKAREACAGTGLWALADDTGLEVKALGGAPGVLSARYAGPGCGYEDNNRKLLEALAGVPPARRGAAFRTVMALAGPAGELIIEEGRLDGAIARRPRGSGGFGYDPVFQIDDGRTLAELAPEEKNALSHRFRALRAILPHLGRLAVGVACLWPLVAAGSARAAKTEEPGQQTIWDEIMASQAHRDLRLGSNFLDQKNYDMAVKEFTRAVAANPKDPLAHMMLGVAYYWTGQVDRSLDSYHRSLELDANNAQAHMLIGISLAWKGDAKNAYREFQRAAEIEPARPDIQMNLGSIEDSLGMTSQSMDHFRKSVSLAPHEPLYHFQLGMLYRKLGRDGEAAEELRQALKYYPGFEDALIELGAVDERRGDLRAAIHDFKKAVELKSRDAVARFRLGRLYLANGEPQKARAIFAEAFHLTPEGGGAGLQLSVSYAGGKKRGPPSDADESQAEPKPAAAPTPSNDPLDVFARNLERIPLEQNAALQVDVVFAPRPKLVKASPESRSSLKRALERRLEPERGAPKAVRREYAIRSGKAEERADQIAKILEDLRQAMKDAPEDSDVRLGMNLAFTRPVDAVARADADSQPKVSYNPREVGNDLGLWIIGTGWMSLVEEILPDPGERPSHPDQADWWVSTGLGYATLGDGQRALAAFERACQLDARSEPALLGRGVANVMIGNEAGAVAAYKQALQLNPKNKPASEGLKWLLRPSTRKSPASGQEAKAR